MIIDFVTALCSIKVWEPQEEDCIAPEPVKRREFKPLTPEAYALGKKPYLGPRITKC